MQQAKEQACRRQKNKHAAGKQTSKETARNQISIHAAGKRTNKMQPANKQASEQW